jgi:hypothetical protein
VPLIVAFKARAEARAILWQAGELTLQEAVDKLQADAERDGLTETIGQDAVQKTSHQPSEPSDEDV